MLKPEYSQNQVNTIAADALFMKLVAAMILAL